MGIQWFGEKFDFENCDAVPSQIGRDLGIKVINLNDEMVNEGGSVETDGKVFLWPAKVQSSVRKKKDRGQK